MDEQNNNPKPNDLSDEEKLETECVSKGIHALEITRRTGTAEELDDKERVEIYGTISAPHTYYRVRKDQSYFDAERAHVKVSYEGMSIGYYTEGVSNRGAQVHGKITDHANLVMLKLLERGLTTWTEKEFVRLLKASRHLIQDDVDGIIDILQNLNVKVETIIEKEDNNRGSKSDLFRTVAESELPDSVTVISKLFAGKHPHNQEVTFVVNIHYHYQNGAMQYWLESPEYETIRTSMADQILEYEIQNFSDSGLPVIYTS